MKLRSTLFATASIATLFAANSVHAQEEAQEPNLAAEPVLVVTAQMREQDPIAVPIALSVVGAEQMEMLSLEEFDELSRYTPGFLVQNQSPNNPGFVMRGITSDDGAATNEPRVSVYQDGVSISKSRGSYVELFDISRVEVAKGPQSTLYGRGALIGAVNIIQNKADPDNFQSYSKLSYGNYVALTSDVMYNVPLGDSAAIRVAGRVRQRDGYVENLLGGDDFNSVSTKAGRVALHKDAGPLTIDLIGNYQKDSPAGTAFKSIAFAPTNPSTGEVIGDTSPYSGAALSAASGFPVGDGLGLDREVWGLTGLAKIDLGNGFALNSTTAYREFSALEVFDPDGISLPLLTASEDSFGKQFNQELRLSYDDGPLSAFVGASYFYERGYQSAISQFDERMALAQITGYLDGGLDTGVPLPAAYYGDPSFMASLIQGAGLAYGLLWADNPNPQVPLAMDPAVAAGIAANMKPGHQEVYTNSGRTRAYDLFGDVTYRVSEQFEIGGGLRYTHDDKVSTFTSSVLNGRSVLGGVIGAVSLTDEATRTALLEALSYPGAADIPYSALYPVPYFGLGLQPTANNGDLESAKLNNGGFSWRLTARYIPNDDTSVYATYSRGRRPEVLAASAPSVPGGSSSFDVLDSETVDSYEVGFKKALNDRTLMLDAAAYYYQYDNFQTTVQNGTQFVITNAGEAESYGLEAQVRWEPTENINLFATYGWNHSRFKTGARDGNSMRLSPDHSASFGALFAHPVGQNRVTFTPSVTWQSKVFFDDDNDEAALQVNKLVPDTVLDEYQDAYALVNARLGYEGPGGWWRAELFVDNLFDENYIIDAGNTGDALGLPTFVSGAPRMYGMSVSFRVGGGQ